jgi:hypothetical protein
MTGVKFWAAPVVISIIPTAVAATAAITARSNCGE